MVPLGMIRVLEKQRGSLYDITQEQVVAEGFPQMSPEEFIAMFCSHNKCQASDIVTRIVFEYL